MSEALSATGMKLEQIVEVLDSVNYAVVVIGQNAEVLYINRAGREWLSCELGEVVGKGATEALDGIFGEAFVRYQRSAGYRTATQYEEYCERLGLWTEVHVCPSPCGLLVCARDVTAKKSRERILTAQKGILELVATGAPLERVLDAITLMIESQSKEDLCSILRLSPDGKRLQLGAGGSLPAEYNAAIEGVEIGPLVGSCGTAAYLRERVVVSDIATDERWSGFKEVALRHGLRACWSQPILSRDGRRVLGTVANYSRRAGEPGERSLLLLETAASLAQIAIEQHLSEKRLGKYALAFENLHDGIVLTNERGEITDMNRAAERMFGRKREESLGSRVESLAGLGGGIMETLAAGGTWRGEVSAVGTDGRREVVESAVLGLRGKEGEIVGTIGVHHDITERKWVELHLKTEAAVARVLAEARGIEEALARVLEAICERYGWEVGSALLPDDQGERLVCKAFWRSKELPAAVEAFERATCAGTFRKGEGSPGRVWGTGLPEWVMNVSAEERFMRRREAEGSGLRGGVAFPVMLEGEVIAVMEFFTRVLRAPDEPMNSMLAVVGGQLGQFIARMRALAAQEKLHVERERLLASEQEARAAAERASRAKDQFIAVLSHELRTPLTPVTAAADLLEKDGRLSEEQRELAAIVRRNVQLEARLIDDLLDATRIGTGKLSLQMGVVDVHELMRDVVQMLQGEAEGKELLVRTGALEHLVEGDGTRLKQVLWNLLKNALKFTPRGGRVSVWSENPSAGRVAVVVEDTGPGIEKGVLERLFTPFEQGGAGVTRRYGGLGLGLAISKGLMELHGGELRAESEGIGKGARFTAEMAACRRKEAGRCAGGNVEERRERKRGLRVLLVEDHPDTARIMVRLLGRFGYEVTHAGDVGTALREADRQKFDVVISDLGLPDGSGAELIGALLARYPVKGIAVSGYGMEEDVRRSMEAGFVAHLTKPVDIGMLEDVLRRIGG